MVKKIALEEHFLCPGFKTTGSRPWPSCRPPCATGSGPHRFRRGAARSRWTAPASSARCWRSPGPACRPNAIPPLRSATPSPATISSQGNPEAAGSLFRLRASADAGRQGRRRRTRTLRERTEIPRRDDQRPHQRAISRPSVARAVLGTRRSARHPDLHPSRPTRCRPRPCWKATRGCAAPPGNGPSRPGSHALRLVFGGVFDRFPKARLGLGHMGETLPFLLWRFDSRAGPDFYNVKLKNPPSHYIKDEHRDHDVGHVLGGAAQLRHRRARPRPHHVLGRTTRSRRPRRPGTGSTARSSTRTCAPISPTTMQ